MERASRAPGHVGDPGKRRAQVPFAVLQHQPVEAPEECGECLSGARRSQDERVFPPGDYWPTQPLRLGRRLKHRPEPCRRYGMKTCERIGIRETFNFRVGGTGRHAALSIAYGE